MHEKTCIYMHERSLHSALQYNEIYGRNEDKQELPMAMDAKFFLICFVGLLVVVVVIEFYRFLCLKNDSIKQKRSMPMNSYRPPIRLIYSIHFFQGMFI